jgi:hypothetical protein
MPSQYPDAHLLGLPRELRELIYDYLAEEPSLLWQQNTPLHITATSPPPFELLLTNSLLYAEILPHFYRHTTITLHVDAFDAIKSQDGDTTFREALVACPHIKQTRTIELCPRMNAGVEFLMEEVDVAVTILIQEAKELRTIIVGWSEVPKGFLMTWRPWVYKVTALNSLKRVVGKVDIVAGRVKVPPPRTAGKEQKGLEKAVAMIVAEGKNLNADAFVSISHQLS